MEEPRAQRRSNPKLPKKHRSASLNGKKPSSVPSLPPLTRPPPSPVGSGSSTPSSAGSGRSLTPTSAGSGRNSPKTSRTLYTPYGESGTDLYNDFAADFDPAAVGFCFQCASACETRELTRTVERTGFRFQQAVDIYRPLYSCDGCLQRLLVRKQQDTQFHVRIVEQALSLYACQQPV
jgi:hypothetical protein